MYHNGWRGDSSEADSSPLVPHLYHQPSSDPATYPPADPNYTHYNHHQMHNHPQMQFVHPNQNQFSHPHLLHNPPPLFQHHSAPQPDFTSTLAQLAAGQRELFETIQSLSVRMDSASRSAAPTVDQLANGLSNINLGRQNLGRQDPPHLPRVSNQQTGTPYVQPP